MGTSSQMAQTTWEMTEKFWGKNRGWTKWGFFRPPGNSGISQQKELFPNLLSGLLLEFSLPFAMFSEFIWDWRGGGGGGGGGIKVNEILFVVIFS